MPSTLNENKSLLECKALLEPNVLPLCRNEEKTETPNHLVLDV
jgi:hypothetical protein